VRSHQLHILLQEEDKPLILSSDIDDCGCFVYDDSVVEDRSKLKILAILIRSLCVFHVIAYSCALSYRMPCRADDAHTIGRLKCGTFFLYKGEIQGITSCKQVQNISKRPIRYIMD
jgi:hypothetical protein